MNFSSSIERQNYDNFIEYVFQFRQTQYSTFYQFDKQSNVYAFQQQQRSYQSNYSYRSSSSQNERNQSYENQFFRFQSTSQELQQDNKNASNSQSQYSQSLRQNYNSVDLSSESQISSKQDIYLNQQEASNRKYRRVYFANENTKNNDLIEKKDYQSDYNDDVENASKILMTSDEYHDEEYVDAQRFNENYVTNDTQEYFVNTFVKQAKIYTCRRCQIEFYFNNKFYRHLRSCQVISTESITSLAKKILNYQVFIIQSIVKSNVQFNLDFRS